MLDFHEKSYGYSNLNCNSHTLNNFWFNGLCVRRKQTKQLLTTPQFSLDVFKPPLFANTQLSAAWKTNLQTLKISNLQYLNSTPLLLSFIDYSGICLGFQISPHKEASMFTSCKNPNQEIGASRP
jgi:hypothetical protein